MTQAVQVAQYGSNNVGLSFKNRIINGDMRIDQRNAGGAVSVGTSSPYTLDRWQGYSGGANTSWQRVASGVTGIPYVLQVTGAASNTLLQLQQKIESQNIADCVGSTVTLSAMLSSSVLTSVTWVVYYANGVDNFSTTTTIATGTFNINSTLSQYSTQISLPANAANGIGIQFTTGALTSGTFKITNVQLEKGSVATSFDYRPYGTEFALCQRYFQTAGAGLVASGRNTSACAIGGTFPVTMRAAPTVATFASSNIIFAGVTLATSGSITFAGPSTTSGFYIDTFSLGSNPGNGVAGIGAGTMFSLTAEL